MNRNIDAYTLLNVFSQQKPFTELKQVIEKKAIVPVVLKGLSGSSKSLLTASYTQGKKGVHVCLMSDIDEASYFYNDLYQLLHQKKEKETDKVLFYPSSFRRSSKYGQEDNSNIVQRTQAIERIKNIQEGELLIIVAYPEALAETIPATSTIEKNMLSLHVGEKVGVDFIKEVLSSYGFQRNDFVYEPGQYAVRGGIVDVFSFADNKPFRIEFFGDDIESIRSFDFNTQLSLESQESVSVVSNLRTMLEEDNQSLFEFIPNNTMLWVSNLSTSASIIDNVLEVNIEKTDAPDLISGTSLKEWFSKFKSVHFSSLTEEKATTIEFNSIPQPSFNKQFGLLAENLIEYNKEKYLTLILAESNKQAERLQSILDSKSDIKVEFSSLRISLHEGFVDRGSKICCYTDHQIFQRYHAYRVRGKVEKSNALTIQELNSLNIGDYIVHIDHGVGVFGGLVKSDINGKPQEMVRLTYKDNDVIFVNLQSLHRISKYRGKDSIPPKIYKLGGKTWANLKQATKKKIKDMADELIQLYAKRKDAEGFAYSPDSYLQNELEASFIYEDTPDQYKATRAVKEDMEKPYPMDRLVCGDVGFGKTEVAMRAAFKAATDGKQVAILVPTTILALQHYKTFKQRFAEFPVKIDFVSRLKSAKEIKETLADVEKGTVDILIGTHRVLSKDVNFKDLGLLIIDEEQKFGVGAKEKIKHMRINVDVLTLTATPIPRTLQFSLLGARDLSTINTPPPNRQPIDTEVHTFNEIVIKEAIEYEIERGGQVFFIHNRIKDIGDIEILIRRLCPNARTITAHGQMDGDALENIMTDFIDYEHDVLISTTIIESGLDIPNANTIIINQAQNFGLSELHQLRGRVGRSNRKAYCYLLAPPEVSQTSEAKRRLRAIEEFSDLGSGFNIAMQDLDIRGAGNLLGGEQSGFINEIGFETYQRIVAEAMTELRDEHHQQNFKKNIDHEIVVHNAEEYVNDCYIDSDLDVHFPDEYISNKGEKLRLYRELDNLKTDEEIDALKLELIDRFGAMPNEAEELLETIKLRHLAVSLGFEKIKIKNEILLLYFVSNPQSAYFSTSIFRKLLSHLQSDSRYRIREQNQKLYIATSNVKTVKKAKEILQTMYNAVIKI